MIIITSEAGVEYKEINFLKKSIMKIELNYPSVEWFFMEYTLSLLSGIDLLSGHIHLQIRDQYRSSEFIEFLKGLDAYYPSTTTIEIILDNHSIHTSKETRAYLKEHSWRFSFIFTPTHGSWLNLIEVFFSKLQRCLLANLRTRSKEGCIEKIYHYIESLNEKPVVFKWSYKMDAIRMDAIWC